MSEDKKKFKGPYKGMSASQYLKKLRQAMKESSPRAKRTLKELGLSQ